jgi:hypothetical protein
MWNPWGKKMKVKEKTIGVVEGVREKGEGIRKSHRGGKYDQSISYACMEMP